MTQFAEMNISPHVNQAIQALGYTTPSPIQSAALPVLLGKPTDFIGLAATGTGKTAAFGIPLIEQINAAERSVQALVLCPTRELALQVTGQLNLLGKFKGISAVPVYGGAGYSEQIRGLTGGSQIVVGTPGRLIDHLERGTLKLEKAQTIVLDEADEMISMGFKEDLEKILQAAPRQTSQIWLFSATMSKEVRRVADTYLTDAQQVQVNRTEMLSTTVEQVYYTMKESDKPEILCKIIEAADSFYGLVFCQTKALVVSLTQYLASRGYKVSSLHGDKSQTEREQTMQAFRDHRISILVCTDVASRGLDVKDVTHVVNYSLPRELDVYVHRIGRTARSGKTGTAISLVTPSHRGLVGRIEHMTKSRMKEGTVPSRRDIGAKKVTQLLAKFQAQTNFPRAVELLNEEWRSAIASMPGEEIVGRFLSILSPEVFTTQEKAKPLQTHPPTTERGRGQGFPGPRRTDRPNFRTRNDERGGQAPGRIRDNHKRKDFREYAPVDAKFDERLSGPSGKPSRYASARPGSDQPRSRTESGGKRADSRPGKRPGNKTHHRKQR